MHADLGIGHRRTEVLAAPRAWRLALNHDGLQHGIELRDVMLIGPGHDERQRDATAVHQQVASTGPCSRRQWRLEHGPVDALPRPSDALHLVVLGPWAVAQLPPCARMPCPQNARAPESTARRAAKIHRSPPMI